MKKKNDTKRQHYIPQRYLKNFSLSGDYLNVFPFSTGQYFSSEIKDIAKEDYYFGSDEAAITFERELGKFERQQNAVFKKIITNYSLNCLNNDEKILLRFFTLFQESRTKFSKKFSHYFANSLKTTNNGNIDFFQKIPRNVGREINDEYRTAFGWTLKAPILCHESISDLKPLLIINTTNQNFICGDAPVVRFNQIKIFNERLQSLYSPGLELFYPINNEVLLFYYDPKAYDIECDFDSTYYLDKQTDLDALNKLQIINALESVFFSDIQQKENIEKIYQEILEIIRNDLGQKYGSYEKLSHFMKHKDNNLWNLVCLLSKYFNYKLDLSFVHKNVEYEQYWIKKYQSALDTHQAPELIRNGELELKVRSTIEKETKSRDKDNY
jgi:hypothetical protein